MPNEIDSSAVNTILELIDELRNNKTRIASDIHFRSKDIQTFKVFIDSLKLERVVEEVKVKAFMDSDTLMSLELDPIILVEESEVSYSYSRSLLLNDFDFYKDVACSVNNIPDSIISTSILDYLGSHSTASPDWTLTLNTDDGKQIVIYNYDENPFLKVCWYVEYDGLFFRVTSLKLGRAINALSNDVFMRDMSKAENLALVYIADHFSYEKSRRGIVYDFIKSCDDDSTDANKSVRIIIISGILIMIIALIAILYKLKRK
jgi:hypothetical protein